MPDHIWRARGNLFWINPFLRLIYMRVDFLKVVRMVFRSRFALTVALCAQKLDLWASLIWGWCPRVRSCPKNKHLAEKRSFLGRERANLKFWGQSLSQAGHYSPIFHQARKGFIYFMTLWLIFYISDTLGQKKKQMVSTRANDANQYNDWLNFIFNIVIIINCDGTIGFVGTAGKRTISIADRISVEHK